METTEIVGAYTQAHRELIEARKSLAEENDRHAKIVASLQKTIDSAKARIAEGDAGLNADLIALARSCIYVRGWKNRGAGGASAITDAIADIASGPKRLRNEYFGAKNYDRWQGQRCDCKYGYGPSHGYIVMEVGLLPEASKRDMTPQERDACLYYLNNIAKIDAASAHGAGKDATTHD